MDLRTSASIVAMQHAAKSKPKIAREPRNGMPADIDIKLVTVCSSLIYIKLLNVHPCF
jgi:hypothetical protein